MEFWYVLDMPERQEHWDEFIEREAEKQYAAELAKKRKDRRRSLQLVTSLALPAALLGAVFSLFMLRSDQSRRERDSKEQTYARYNQEAQLAALIKRADEAQKENMRLEDLLQQALSGKGKAIGQTATPGLPDKSLFKDLQKSNRDLDERMGALETAIVQTPEKAISLPLIRQQLVDMQDKDKGESEALHGEIGRLYGIMQWFLALIITIIIGVGSMAINSFRQSGDKGKIGAPTKPYSDKETGLPNAGKPVS